MSVKASSTPVTVTVCAVFQFVAENVRLAGLTVASPVSLLLRATVTSAVGCDPSFTVNVSRFTVWSAVFSLVITEVFDSTRPTVSSSVLRAMNVRSGTSLLLL